MQTKLTVQERLKDLRVVEHGLTLEELAERTGLSRSALGKYESDETAKDISPYAILKLAKFYGVSMDYLQGLTENKNHPNTELDALHLSDDAIAVLTSGDFNHRLLSEMICHKDFQRLMLDAEIYVDRIVDMRITEMNAIYEAMRQEVIRKKGERSGRHAPAGFGTGTGGRTRVFPPYHLQGSEQNPSRYPRGTPRGYHHSG